MIPAPDGRKLTESGAVSDIVVGADGKVAAVWPKVKVAGHAAAVLKALG